MSDRVPLTQQGPAGSSAGIAMADGGISVIIPAYNVEGFIAEAVASVATQTRAVQEILVIDDGSTDGTATCLRKMAGTDARLRILTGERPSSASAIFART
jgi:glycosyltransferase involved in cell wall biosynthesis